MILVLTETAVKLSRLQINDSLLRIKSGRYISIVSALIMAPYFKM